MSDDEVNEVLASLIAEQPTPSKRSRNTSKPGSVKKRMRKLEAARLAKHAAEDTAAAAAAAAHGKAAKAAKVTKVAKGAAPNAGLAAETEAEKRARATFEKGADRQVPWTHHFDFRLHPPRIVIARGGGLRRVLCSAFSKAPWPPLCERPLHLVSNLQRNVYDVTYPSEEAVKLTMYQDTAAWAKDRWQTADGLSDAQISAPHPRTGQGARATPSCMRGCHGSMETRGSKASAGTSRRRACCPSFHCAAAGGRESAAAAASARRAGAGPARYVRQVGGRN